MAQLETTLGVQLFSRSRSGIALTHSGALLRRRAEALEALLATAEREIALAREEVTGPIAIGGTPGALTSLLPFAASSLRAAGVRFELRIIERSDAALVELLRNETVEIAIVTTGIEPPPPDIIEEPIASDPFDLIVGEANAALPDQLRLRDLSEMPWVLPDAAGAFRRQVDALFIAAQTPQPSNVIRCDSLITTKAIVRQSDYATLLPRQVAAAELEIGALRAITLSDVKLVRSIGVRRLADRQPSSLAEQFLALLQTYHSEHMSGSVR